MKRVLLTCLTLLAFGANPAWSAEKLPVVASFSVLGDMVKTIGGDDVDVTTLVGPDMDSHSFEPTPADGKAIASAKLLVINGLGFEGWIERLAQSAGYKGAIVTASAGIKTREMAEEEEGHGHEHEHGHDHHDEHGHAIDPHAWQSLRNGEIYAANIADALKKALPEKADAIQSRADAYIVQIKETDQWVRDQFAAIPQARRKIITSHDAFGYFGDAYGITFMSPEGLSTESEPTPKDVAELADQIKHEGVKKFFVENMSSPRLIEQIAKDTGATIGGTLFSDALSGPESQSPTYLDMFRNNAALMAAAMKESQ